MKDGSGNPILMSAFHPKQTFAMEHLASSGGAWHRRSAAQAGA